MTDSSAIMENVSILTGDVMATMTVEITVTKIIVEVNQSPF